jgi:hypothetical protein
MKKMLFTLIAMLTIAATASAMSYEQARREALFLTDKMAYELNLTDAQYEAAYEINLDYLMGVTSRYDVFGTYWERRNLDLQYILLSWQWNAFCAATYFYRPLYWDAGYWHFGIYAHYPRRDYFYFGLPHFYATYRGGHSWRMNGGRSFYEHHRDHYQGPGGHGREHSGMRDGWDRGDYRSSGGSSSTRVTGGDRGSYRNGGSRSLEGGNSPRSTTPGRDGRGSSTSRDNRGGSSAGYGTDRSGSSQRSIGVGERSSGSFGGSRSSVGSSSRSSSMTSPSYGSSYGRSTGSSSSRSAAASMSRSAGSSMSRSAGSSMSRSSGSSMSRSAGSSMSRSAGSSMSRSSGGSAGGSRGGGSFGGGSRSSRR